MCAEPRASDVRVTQTPTRQTGLSLGHAPAASQAPVPEQNLRAARAATPFAGPAASGDLAPGAPPPRRPARRHPRHLARRHRRHPARRHRRHPARRHRRHPRPARRRLRRSPRTDRRPRDNRPPRTRRRGQRRPTSQPDAWPRTISSPAAPAAPRAKVLGWEDVGSHGFKFRSQPPGILTAVRTSF